MKTNHRPRALIFLFRFLISSVMYSDMTENVAELFVFIRVIHGNQSKQEEPKNVFDCCKIGYGCTVQGCAIFMSSLILSSWLSVCRRVNVQRSKKRSVTDRIFILQTLRSLRIRLDFVKSCSLI